MYVNNFFCRFIKESRQTNVKTISGTRHGRERYFKVKAIVKSIIFPTKLSRQLSSQLCDQTFSSRQLSSQFFFLKLFEGNCQVNCVTKKIVQGNCQVNYLVKLNFILYVNYCDFLVDFGKLLLILVDYGQLWSIIDNCTFW